VSEKWVLCLASIKKQDNSINIIKIGSNMNNSNASQGGNVQQQFPQYFYSFTPEKQAKLLAQLHK